MTAPSDIIRQLLINLGHATALGAWPIYTSFLPDEPDNAIAVFDTAGKFDGRIMSTGEQVEHPGIQVRVRGLVYPTTWEKAQTIAEALDSQNQITIAISSEDVYALQNVSRSGPVLPAGVDEDRRRYHFTINATVTVRAT